MWKPEWPRHLLKVLGLALLSSVAGSDCGSSIPHPPRMPSATLSRASLITEIAFGSCYVPQFERSEIWHAIASSNPDVFLFLGDNVYQSEEKGEPELLELREAYALLARDEPFAALRSRIPVLTTWDDHDYGLDNAGAEFAAKYQSEALFEEVWAIPASDPRKSRDGIYHRRIVGPMGRRVQMILLDTRFFRTSPESENSDALEPTMLGVEQWRWLETNFDEPAEIRILVSSIPLLSQNDQGESWNGWPRERERLFAMLDRTSGTIVLLSGDSHFGSFYRRTDTGDQPLWELTSSSLNLPLPEANQYVDSDPARVGPAHFEENFGFLSIDWTAKVISLELRNAAGETIAAQRIPVSR